uniref:Uncharacterized protein n=1 Tax=Cacopsylla melanoneura TaxID=428564 RepID=A0A8D8WIA4_9HEMI
MYTTLFSRTHSLSLRKDLNCRCPATLCLINTRLTWLRTSLHGHDTSLACGRPGFEYLSNKFGLTYPYEATLSPYDPVSRLNFIKFVKAKCDKAPNWGPYGTFIWALLLLLRSESTRLNSSPTS